jgi:hypothetical protein
VKRTTGEDAESHYVPLLALLLRLANWGNAHAVKARCQHKTPTELHRESMS